MIPCQIEINPIRLGLFKYLWYTCMDHGFLSLPASKYVQGVNIAKIIIMYNCIVFKNKATDYGYEYLYIAISRLCQIQK